MKWYAVATSRILRKHWQALVLSILLLLPAIPVFAQSQILGAPVLAVLAPEHRMEWRFAWVHLLEAVGVLWVWAQRGAIAGGPFAGFLKSLPVSNGRRRFADAVVILVASTPLLLPMLAATVALAFLPHKAANYLFVLDLFLITLGWQLTAFSRDVPNAVALIVANGFLVGGLGAETVLRSWLLFAPLLLAFFAITYTGPSSVIKIQTSGCFPRRLVTSVRYSAGRVLSPTVSLQIGILRDRKTSTAGRCAMMCAVVGCSGALLEIWDFDTRAVPLALIAQAAIAFIASTAYHDLRAAHRRASPFMQSLPISAFAKMRVDCLTIAALALPFASIVPLMLAIRGALPWRTAPALLGSGVPLLALLYLPQRYAPGQSPLFGTIVSVLWVGAAWQYFV
ncbi:DUF6136 family protein [Paraburkholderia sp. J69-2]|uniref:DUF6136 family protein n=1 Tax=Paraburkholderia sp. J69-2 TaxID=2805437 RepID=UPI002AAFF5EE|nr:DUF6136 family protein [Paraburkholderia sp. J69-2]